ncbi:MAG: bifunctional precorrin-2 dehydrogenase/sirohydrochlorin ferrochelatase [Oscillospiraceae bacterium]|nr:bifunctional precorrin-2 dehydrogenase/sirohydrochlorin ferrochelatase [Oscillospiraceae bacterium]
MTEKPGYFPAFLKTEGKRVLVIGAGTIGSRRIAALAQFRWQVDVIAPTADDKVIALQRDGQIRYSPRKAELSDISGYDMVLVCTDSKELNHSFVLACRHEGIPVNDCSSQQDCDFFFPGLVILYSLVVGVTAGGCDHRKARRIRERIEEILEEEINSHE